MQSYAAGRHTEGITFLYNYAAYQFIPNHCGILPHQRPRSAFLDLVDVELWLGKVHQPNHDRYQTIIAVLKVKKSRYRDKAKC